MKNVSDNIGINVESVNVLKPQNEMQESATDQFLSIFTWFHLRCNATTPINSDIHVFILTL